MDIQTKFILFNGFQRKECHITNETNWLDPIFSFSEYSRCELTFESNDPTATLELEYLNEEGVATLSPYDQIVLADTQVRDEGYIPGNFKLKLTTPGGFR